MAGTAFDTLGLTVVEELFKEYLLPLSSNEECDRIVGWRLCKPARQCVVYHNENCRYISILAMHFWTRMLLVEFMTSLSLPIPETITSW